MNTTPAEVGDESQTSTIARRLENIQELIRLFAQGPQAGNNGILKTVNRDYEAEL